MRQGVAILVNLAIKAISEPQNCELVKFYIIVEVIPMWQFNKDVDDLIFGDDYHKHSRK